MSSCLCDQCAALCCRYFALQIDEPETARQYDDIRWYLCHENIFIFIEEDKWYLGIQNRCKHLQPDNRCGIYETRPKICREYSTENCDFRGGEYNFQKLFISAEQFQAYAREQLADARRKKRKKQKSTRARKPASNGRAAQAITGHPSALRRRKKAAPAGGAQPRSTPNGRAISLPVLRP